uniref:DUF834 domain-containing protein n=1 Tax=Oryza punctata TaxID=4537 RepID=A0A0E0L1P8_ORYPU
MSPTPPNPREKPPTPSDPWENLRVEGEGVEDRWIRPPETTSSPPPPDLPAGAPMPPPPLWEKLGRRGGPLDPPTGDDVVATSAGSSRGSTDATAAAVGEAWDVEGEDEGIEIHRIHPPDLPTGNTSAGFASRSHRRHRHRHIRPTGAADAIAAASSARSGVGCCRSHSRWGRPLALGEGAVVVAGAREEKALPPRHRHRYSVGKGTATAAVAFAR